MNEKKPIGCIPVIVVAIVVWMIWCFGFPEEKSLWEKHLEEKKAVQSWMERNSNRRLVP